MTYTQPEGFYLPWLYEHFRNNPETTVDDLAGLLIFDAEYIEAVSSANLERSDEGIGKLDRAELTTVVTKLAPAMAARMFSRMVEEGVTSPQASSNTPSEVPRRTGYTLPEDVYYSWPYQYLRTHAPSFVELIPILMQDDDFVDEVSWANESEEGEALKDEELERAVEILAPSMAVLMCEEFKKEAAEWGTETDNIRITRALQSLSPEIQVFEDFACCGSCGFYEIRQSYEAGELPSAATGFVFYNQQTTEKGYEYGRLYFTYDTFTGDDEGLEVAKKVYAALAAEGFTPEWDGTANNTVELSGITWQRAPQA